MHRQTIRTRRGQWLGFLLLLIPGIGAAANILALPAKAPTPLSAQAVGKTATGVQIQVKNRHLSEVLQSIQNASGIQFEVSDSLMETPLTISITAPGWTPAVQQLLKNYNHIDVYNKKQQLHRVYVMESVRAEDIPPIARERTRVVERGRPSMLRAASYPAEETTRAAAPDREWPPSGASESPFRAAEAPMSAGDEMDSSSVTPAPHAIPIQRLTTDGAPRRLLRGRHKYRHRRLREPAPVASEGQLSRAPTGQLPGIPLAQVVPSPQPAAPALAQQDGPPITQNQGVGDGPPDSELPANAGPPTDYEPPPGSDPPPDSELPPDSGPPTGSGPPPGSGPPLQLR